MTTTASAYLILNPGCKRVDPPFNLLRLVPKALTVEAIQEEDGTKVYAFVRQSKTGLKHVDLVLTDEEISLPDEELKERYLKPACRMLGEEV